MVSAQLEQPAAPPSPFTEFDNWLREMFGVSGEGTGAFAPAAEVARDGDDAVIRIELPGVDVDNDVNVEVEGNRLVIHGERRDERAEEKEGRTVREIRYGSFSRTFTLPSHVTGDAISASYDKGVLTVRVAGLTRERKSSASPSVNDSKAIVAVETLHLRRLASTGR
ncbi:hsp20/alpha crystallin family protein [Mycobacterium xenopi 3993]|nr:hsp20/alpha crystallin family protein [Mycobacterium xenopi 3993]